MVVADDATPMACHDRRSVLASHSSAAMDGALALVVDENYRALRLRATGALLLVVAMPCRLRLSIGLHSQPSWPRCCTWNIASDDS